MTTKFKTVQSKFRIREAQQAHEGKRRNTMQGGTIVQRKANTFIPNEYLEKVLTANPNCWGAAMVDEGELKLNSGEEGATLEFIQETMKAFADKDITFYFGHADAALSRVDIPPHELIVKQDGDDVIPQIVGFFDGNFPAYDKAGSSHPPEYHLAVDYLIPKLEGLAEMADGDLDKVTAQLQKPYFKKELLLTSVSRGTITLVCANGTCLTFAQSDLSAEYPWGWVSNTHGYATTAAPKAEEPKKKPSMFAGKSTVREPAPKPDNVTAATKAIAEAVTAPKTDGAIIKNYTVKSERPPAHLTRRERKDWYPQRIGYRPAGWEKNIAVDVAYDPKGKLLTFAQIKALGLEATKVMALLKNNPPKSTEKDTEPSLIPETKSETGPAVTTEILPIMSPDTRKYVKQMMADPAIQKIIAENADMITDPAKVQAIEAKFTDFARQVGATTIDDFLKLDYEQLFNLGKERLDGLAILCWSLKNIVAAHRSKVKVEAPAVEAAPASGKKPSMFAKAG